MTAERRRAVFLDRDGTINEEVDYLHRVEEFAFIPGAMEAIRLLKDAGYAVVIVTNQSGIGRGYYGEADLATLHRHMDENLAEAGTGVDGYYFCPHHPEHAVGEYRTDCDCRKPLPGMLLRAAEELSLDLGRSYVIGDKISDIEAGLNAGCTPLLVRTGYGAGQEHLLPARVAVCDDLLEAARVILSRNE